MRRVAIGIQDFAKIREENRFYIDKTSFIEEWWENGDAVTLISRPRRFGKTITMSMVDYFFSNQYSHQEQLFSGLSIWKDEKYRKLAGTAPVIFLSFADIKSQNYKEAVEEIKSGMVRLYGCFSYLENWEGLSDKEKYQFQSVNYGMGDVVCKGAVRDLSNYLSRYYGKKVLILLDEYDTPMQEAYLGGYWNEMVQFIRGLFNSTFKTNPYMDRAIMTGVTRVSKESIFSDLNNLTVITTTSNKYETSFGFTEEEVFSGMDELGIDAGQKKVVKDWYDGFTFGEHKDIYNPWSIINYFSEKRLAPYWAESSSNGLISRLVQQADPQIKYEMEQLMRGDCLEKIVDEQIVFQQLDEDKEAVWSLMLASGYLCVDSFSVDSRSQQKICQLKITNFETELMFEKMICGWFREPGGNYNQFTKALLCGEVEDMNVYLQEVLDATVSNFDIKRKSNHDASKLREYALQLANGEIATEQFEQKILDIQNKKVDPESFYHALVLGMLVDLREIYRVKSNRESGRGRYDVMLIPRKIDDKKSPAIVIEFKVFDSKKEKTLKQTAKRALLQIEEKRYDVELRDMGIQEASIRHYGFAFRGKEVLVLEEN